MNLVMTTKQFEVLNNLAKAFEAVQHIMDEHAEPDFEFIYHSEMDLKDASLSARDIEDHEIFNLIKRYTSNELKDFASIAISNNTAIVIVEVEDEKVFGYYYDNEEKEYFLSEIARVSDENKEELDHLFYIGDGKFNLNEAMRLNF